jgi:hypothetical protein
VAENYGPFASGAGASFTAQWWQDFWANFFSPGVIQGATIVGAAANNLQATAPGSGMSVNLGTGVAFANGFWYENTATLNKTIAGSDTTLNRIDYLVVTLNFATPNVTSRVLTGTLASSPVAPSLTQTSSTYDIPIATVTVNANTANITSGMITDRRVYCGVKMNPVTMGSGSGLNADLLDGLNSSAFVQTAGQVLRILAVTGAQPTNATGSNSDLIIWYVGTSLLADLAATSGSLGELSEWSQHRHQNALPMRLGSNSRGRDGLGGHHAEY